MGKKVQLNLRISEEADALLERLCLKTVRGKGDMVEFLILQETRKEEGSQVENGGAAYLQSSTERPI